MNEVKFAGTIVEVDNEVVAKVTEFSRELSISEEKTTGSEDVVPGTDVLQEQFVSIGVSETAKLAGIATESADTGPDTGQSALKEAAEAGETVVLKQTKNTGYGYALSGFFTGYAETGSTAGVYKFSGSFRVNSKTEITPGS
jgi:hypothetical protein